MSTDEIVKPWYRQPWLWFLVLFPAMSIVYCIVALTLALSGDVSMVSDDYSREGRGINQIIARDLAARELGLEGHLASAGRKLTLELSDRYGPASYDYLVLKLFHPTHDSKDRTAQLRKVSNGHYSAQIPGEIDGRWYLELSGPDNSWRLQGEGFLPAREQLVLKPDVPERG